jgi:hypothetical protein
LPFCLSRLLSLRRKTITKTLDKTVIPSFIGSACHSG